MSPDRPSRPPLDRVTLAALPNWHVEVVEASPSTNAQIAASEINDATKLFLVRTATGTVSTTGAGIFEVEGWQRPQARV